MSTIKSVYSTEELRGKNVYSFNNIRGDIMGLINILVVNIGILENYHKDRVNYQLIKDICFINGVPCYNTNIRNEQNEIIPYDPLLGMTVNNTVKNNSIIVILGNMINGKDVNTFIYDEKRLGEFIHEDIKIILLINKLIDNGCIIIKLCGYHEFINITCVPDSNCKEIQNFLTQYTKKPANNITIWTNRQGRFKDEYIKRADFFMYNEYGYKLLIHGGFYNIVRLGNYLFCCGGINILKKIKDPIDMDVLNGYSIDGPKFINNPVLQKLIFDIVTPKNYRNFDVYIRDLAGSFDKIIFQPIHGKLEGIVVGGNLINNCNNIKVHHTYNYGADKIGVLQTNEFSDNGECSTCYTPYVQTTINYAKYRDRVLKIIQLNNNFSRVFDTDEMYNCLQEKFIITNKCNGQTEHLIARMPTVLKIFFRNTITHNTITHNIITHNIIKTLLKTNMEYQARFYNFIKDPKIYGTLMYIKENEKILINEKLNNIFNKKKKYKKYKLQI